MHLYDLSFYSNKSREEKVEANMHLYDLSCCSNKSREKVEVGEKSFNNVSELRGSEEMDIEKCVYKKKIEKCFVVGVVCVVLKLVQT